MKIKRLHDYICFIILLLSIIFLPDKVISGNIYKQLSVVKCDSLIKANETNPNFIILDVRTPTEWNGYHLLGSINNSTGSPTFDAELAALPKQKLYLLHCQSGGRSAGAFLKMKSLGFAAVYEMIGGLNAWNAAGLPTTTIAGPKLMLAGILKSTKSTVNDTTIVKVTNRSNGKLTFSKFTIKDDHALNYNFDLAKTLNGAEDYSFLVIHPSGLGDSTKITIESSGGNIVFAIGNSVSVNNATHILTDLNVYPNPANDILNISTTHSLIDEILVFDLAGRMVYRNLPESNSETIDLLEFKEGIYLSKVRVEGQIISRKIIVSR